MKLRRDNDSGLFLPEREQVWTPHRERSNELMNVGPTFFASSSSVDSSLALLVQDGVNTSTVLYDRSSSDAVNVVAGAQFSNVQQVFGKNMLAASQILPNIPPFLSNGVDSKFSRASGQNITIECYVRWNSLPNSGPSGILWELVDPTGGRLGALWLWANTGKLYYVTGVTAPAEVATLTANVTHFVQFTVIGNTYYTDVDGTQVDTNSFPASNTAGFYKFFVGADNSSVNATAATWWVTPLRFTRAALPRGGVPSGAWTVPTLTTSATQKLLLHFEGANNETGIIDSSVYGRLLLGNAAAKISTAQAKWGSSSLRIGRTTSGIGITIPAHVDFGTTLSQPHWLEFWLYFQEAVIDNFGTLFSWFASGGSLDLLHYVKSSSGGGTRYVSHEDEGFGDPETFPYPSVIPVNTWVHIAFGNDGTTDRRWQDGVVKFTQSRSAGAATTKQINIGGYHGYSDTTDDGTTAIFIDELRFLIGECPYTANFTPPTGPYT